MLLNVILVLEMACVTATWFVYSKFNMPIGDFGKPCTEGIIKTKYCFTNEVRVCV